MLKTALELYVVSLIFTSPIIILGLCKYNLKLIQESNKEFIEVILTGFIFSLIPTVNVAVAVINFVYLIAGDSNNDETR